MRDKVRDFFRYSHSDDSTTTKKHYFDIFHRKYFFFSENFTIYSVGRSSTNSYAVTTPASKVSILNSVYLFVLGNRFCDYNHPKTKNA